jgi:hypothetical protein
VGLSSRYIEGGNKDFPHQSVKLYDEGDIYVVVQGEKSKWTSDAIDRAKTEFLKGFRPWFCQVCGCRQCPECGFPINYPGASDVLYDDGSSSHCPAFAGGQGCINPNCKK